MIIREIEIKAFGRLENRSFSFGEGVNLIQGENETGKTTLQAFIRAMLFGMERGRGRASKEDAYTRYKPWNNPGNYGGRLDLTAGGTNYRLIRDFAKDGRNLTVLNLDTGAECSDFAEKVLAPLGLNEGNYRNALLIVQGGGPSGKELADGLGDKMIHMATGGDKELAASLAISHLEGKVRELNRKKTEKRLSELEERIQDRGRLEEEAEQLNEELEELTGRLQENEVALKVGESGGKDGIPSGVLYFLAGMGCLILFALLCQILPVAPAAAVALAVFLLAFLSREGRGRRRGKELEAVRLEREELQVERGKLAARQEEADRRLDAESGLEEEYSEARREWEQEALEREALETAASVLKEVSGRIKSGFGTDFQKELSKAACELTEGGHERIYLDEEFRIKLSEDGQIKPLGQFSKGTGEQMNLALSLAAGKLLFQEEMPLFLDDALVNYDGSRIRKALAFLNREHKGQIILCSCTEREAECLDDAGISYRFLTLREELKN